MKTCSKCGITLRGSDQEGDICLTCLSSLTPHCNFDQGYSTIEGAIRQSTNNKIMNNKPTNFSIKQSLEVVWEAIHEWNEQASDKEYSEDDVKLGMAWIMEELGYGYDKDGEIEKEDRPL
jgi:hypothetical protein